MRRSLTLVTGPANEPVTLSETMSWLRLDTDDTQISQLITAARGSAEEYLRRSLITQTLKLTLDLTCSYLDSRLGAGTYDLPISALYGAMPRSIELPKGPIQSITSVTTYDLTDTSSIFDPSNYTLDSAGARLVLKQGSIWPSNLRPIAPVEIVFVTGYGPTANDIPQPIKTGMMIHVASIYEQRGQCADAMDIPAGAKQLYSQYRILGERRG